MEGKWQEPEDRAQLSQPGEGCPWAESNLETQESGSLRGGQSSGAEQLLGR